MTLEERHKQLEAELEQFEALREAIKFAKGHITHVGAIWPYQPSLTLVSSIKSLDDNDPLLELLCVRLEGGKLTFASPNYRVRVFYGYSRQDVVDKMQACIDEIWQENDKGDGYRVQFVGEACRAVPELRLPVDYNKVAKQVDLANLKKEVEKKRKELDRAEDAYRKALEE